jgi:hypothetical protein
MFPFFDCGFVEAPRAADPESGNTPLAQQTINGGWMNPQMPRQLGDCQYVTLSTHRVSLPRAGLASEVRKRRRRIEDGAKVPARSKLCQGTIRGTNAAQAKNSVRTERIWAAT